MPRRLADMTPEEREIRRTRVTPYQARIERRLTDVYIEVPTTRQANAEWIFTHAIHINGYTICELCGHNPIRRLFFIEHRETGQTLCLGSECIRNYVNVDLVDAYVRRMAREQGHIRQRRRSDEVARRIRERSERRRSERYEWQREHQALITWLNQNHSQSSFLTSLHEWLQAHGSLTPNQTQAAENIMNRRQQAVEDIREIIGSGTESSRARSIAEGTIASGTIRTGGITEIDEATAAANEEPATMHEAEHIPNGIFSETDMSSQGIQIWTVRSGGLANKRIIKYWNESFYAWKGFAFLTANGHVRKWRNSDVSDEVVARANRILVALRNNLRLRTAHRTCRICNGDQVNAANGLCPIHNPERVMNRDRTAQRIRRLARPTTTVEAPAPPLSELGTGEIL